MNELDQNTVLNDPSMVPLMGSDQQVFVSSKGKQTDRFIIASSSLRIRLESTAYGKSKTWLAWPPRYPKESRS